MKTNILVAIFILRSAINVASFEKGNQLGCYKVPNHQIGCNIKPREVQELWKQKVIKSIANAIQWMREQSHTYTLLAVDIIQSFVLSGYINDEGVCSNNLNQEKAKLAKEIDHSEKLSGGQLAKSLIGLKASCYDNVKRQSLISILKRKMSKYPQGEFNNFFQLSLAMIALYVNNVEVPSIYGQKLLRGVFIGKKRFRPLKKDKMSDTEAMGIMALLTLLHQQFTAHWVRKHAQKEVKKAEIKLQKILEDSSENNLATISLILQTITATNPEFLKKRCCMKIIKSILHHQKQNGSFGSLQETAYAIMALNGRSILDIKDLTCPITKEKSDTTTY